LDLNGNGVLDAGKVSNTRYIWNGAAGSVGSAGAAGTAGVAGGTGSNGLSSLVSVSVEPAGANCANGGNLVRIGLDTSRDGNLDDGEVTSRSHVCNAGNGTHGANGTDGTNGADGANGTNGLNSLVVLTALASGDANCAYGGSRQDSGLDLDRNGSLDFGEITASAYACNGSPGPGVSWIDVTATSAQAQANTGYLADNAAPVTITLPASPNLGDLVSVSGVGSGGWTVAQNAGQRILTRGLPGSPLPGDLWTPRDSARDWISVASSANGSKLVAVTQADQIYTSIDSGVTWTPRDGFRGWNAVASSADGSKLVAVAIGNQIYTSTDSGQSWTPRESSRTWWGVASSADGTHLVAVEFYGQIYTSTDSGVSWTPRDSARPWQSVASSADGSKLYATALDDGLYISADAGVTWTAATNHAPTNRVACSADGTKLLAAGVSGPLYISTDSGATWVARDSVRGWSGLASSADGSKLVAVADTGDLDRIYTSVADQTTPGSAGSLGGSQYDALQLQYAGSGNFIVLGFSSNSGSFVAQ
jgi:hypothetical protein